MHWSCQNRNFADLLPEQGAIIQEDGQRSTANYQKKIAYYLLQIACLNGLEKLPATRALPYHFLTCLQKVMGLYDESNRFFLGHLRRLGYTIQCVPGCTHCCRNMPSGLSSLELIYVYHGMHERGISSRSFRRFLEVEELFTEVFLQCRNLLEPFSQNPAGMDQVLSRYQDLEQPCPFLQTGLCQIYPYRPFACRMHFSLSPRYRCDPKNPQRSHAVTFNLQPGDCVFEAIDRIESRLRFKLSEVLACGLLELTVNLMKFERIQWI